MKIHVIITPRAKEQGIPKVQQLSDQQQEPGALRRGLDVLSTMFTAGKLLQDPKSLADQEIKNYLDPARKNSSVIR